MKNRFIRKLQINLFCSLFLFSIFGYAVVPHTLQTGLNSIVDQAKRKGLNTHMGILVQSLQNGSTLYQYQSSFMFTPASVQKLFTAVAALSYLGPNFHFSTKLLSSGIVTAGVLHGSLTLKFSGDPELKKEDLNELFKQLLKIGIYKIDGSIYIDETDYNAIPNAPGCLWDDLSFSYAAPVTAIIINKNKFALRFIPAPRDGEKPLLKTDLPPDVAHFINDMTTTSRAHNNCPAKITVYSYDKNRYLLSGCLSRHLGEQARSLAVRDPSKYALAIVKQLLAENSIPYTGRIEMHAADPNSHVLAAHFSAPLSEIIKKMLKKSDNVRTHAIFKKLGQVYYKTQGTWQNGLEAMKEILAPTHISFNGSHLSDGAGLSRDNLISPEQLSRLLYFAYHHPAVREYLFPSLPIAGKDGTLRFRMPSEGKSERIHGKTGSLKGVSSLAGYISTRHHGMISFVIMINGIAGARYPYIHLEDHICEFLANAP